MKITHREMRVVRRTLWLLRMACFTNKQRQLIEQLQEILDEVILRG